MEAVQAFHFYAGGRRTTTARDGRYADLRGGRRTTIVRDCRFVVLRGGWRTPNRLIAVDHKGLSLRVLPMNLVSRAYAFLYAFSKCMYTDSRSAVFSEGSCHLTLWYLVWRGCVCFGGPYVRFFVAA